MIRCNPVVCCVSRKYQCQNLASPKSHLKQPLTTIVSAAVSAFEHRRSFIESELLRLGQVFFLEVVVYAVMSNHVHIVLFIDQQAENDADALDTVRRWHQIHQGNTLSAKFLNQEPIEPHECERLDTLIDLWRVRLSSISWYMPVLNEKVARMANAEDEVTGRFWEGRFKCQALLDEQALLTCMAYVCLLYTSPSPRDRTRSRMPSSA